MLFKKLAVVMGVARLFVRLFWITQSSWDRLVHLSIVMGCQERIDVFYQQLLIIGLAVNSVLKRDHDAFLAA